MKAQPAPQSDREWVRLGSISNYDGRKTKVNAQNASPSTWGLDLEDIEKGGRIIERKTIGERKAVGDKTVFCSGDILYSKLRPYLLKILVAPDDGICTSEIVPFSVYGGISVDYIVSYLKSPYVDGLINSITYGIKMPRVGTETMVGLLVPIPPLEEQTRICAKIIELEPHIDDYACAEQANANINAAFPDMLKKSILQMAVQGKLVPQDPTDEPAEALLVRIREQKEQLIREGKIKRDKHESIIYRRDNSHYELVDGIERCIDDEIPFEIPETWAWVRIKSTCDGIVDCPHSTPQYLEYATEYWAVDTNCIDDAGNLIKKRFVDEITYKKRIGRLVPSGGDIVITREGTIGRALILPPDCNICLGQRVMLLRPSTSSICTFLRFYIATDAFLSQLSRSTRGIGAKHVNVGDVCNALMPLPPAAEQKRIVSIYRASLNVLERNNYECKNTI